MTPKFREYFKIENKAHMVNDIDAFKIGYSTIWRGARTFGVGRFRSSIFFNERKN